MATASVTVSGSLTGLVEGSSSISFTYSNSSAPGIRATVDLTTTSKSVAEDTQTGSIPSGTLYILLVPPSTNSNVLKIHGASGEAHAASSTIIHPTSPVLITMPAASPALFLSASATTSLQVYYL